MSVLKHPNIVKVHEWYRTSNTDLHIVLEFADNGSLLDHVKKRYEQRNYFTDEEILKIFA